MKKTYLITVSDSAVYTIKAASRERAEDLAVEWFAEREPTIIIKETNDEPDVEI